MFLDGKIFIGIGESVLEKTVAEFKKPQDSITKNPQIQQFLRTVPKDAVAFGYTDFGSTAVSYLEMIEIAVSLTTNKELKKVINPAKRPTATDLPWVAFSYSYERENELVGEGFLVPKK